MYCEVVKKTCEVVKKTKHLGIDLVAKSIDLYKYNYDRLWVQIEKDLAKWDSLNLSFGQKKNLCGLYL